MNFVFRPYPSHSWIAEWTFEPTGCTTSYRENCGDHFFRTQPAVGQIVPHTGNPEWALQIPIPENSRINLLCNGFCAYFEQRKIRCGAEVLVPEPGVVWGRFSNIPQPLLLADEKAVQSNDGCWIESDTLNAFLAVRDSMFCMVSKCPVKDDALRVADDYLNRDFEAAITSELDRRAGATALFEDMAHHDSLAVIGVESMMKALRPAEGRIPHLWSQSALDETPRLDVNELYPLARAWSLIDPLVAEELLLCALKIQTNAGALPVHFSPHTTYSIIEAPKPMLAKTAEAVWATRRNAEYLDQIIPLLRRHVQWMLHHFDPKRRGTYSWKNQNEPLVPGLYQSDLVTVDLAVLLLTEIEALNRLQESSLKFASQPPYFNEERVGLEHSIAEQFWNGDEAAFTNALLRDTVKSLHGFPQLTPLLWKGLPQTQRVAILELIRESETLPGQNSVLSWRTSAMDDGAYPLLPQFLMFQALKTSDPHGAVLNDFSRLTIQRFVEWHTLSLESGNTLSINPATAAFIITVQAMHKYRHHANGALGGWFLKVLRKARADRTDLMVIAATLLVLFCVHTLYEHLKAPPPFEFLETQMNSAYVEKDIDRTLQAALSIMEHYPEAAARARLLAANILMLSGEYAEAESLYTVVREAYPDSPGAMISLGLAQQLQGRFPAAQSNYYEFCYLFDEIFPEVVEEVNQFRYLMQEGFKTPPKWQEIYRYQFMHELQ